jgi:hypothetical protein
MINFAIGSYFISKFIYLVNISVFLFSSLLKENNFQQLHWHSHRYLVPSAVSIFSAVSELHSQGQVHFLQSEPQEHTHLHSHSNVPSLVFRTHFRRKVEEPSAFFLQSPESIVQHTLLDILNRNKKYLLINNRLSRSLLGQWRNG